MWAGTQVFVHCDADPRSAFRYQQCMVIDRARLFLLMIVV